MKPLADLRIVAIEQTGRADPRSAAQRLGVVAQHGRPIPQRGPGPVEGLLQPGAPNLMRLEHDVTVGQNIDVTLGNVGPAVYLSPPRISSGALTFLGVEDALPHVPAGVTQRFRFKAVRRGRAIVTFTRERRRSEVRVVEDTFQVRPRRGGSAPR